MAAREQHFCRVSHERAEVKLASTLFRALVPAAAGPKVSARFLNPDASGGSTQASRIIGHFLFWCFLT
jgi:hypothetical protein